MVKTLATNGSDQAFHEGMRERYRRYRRYFGDLQDAEGGLPAVAQEQRIVVRAETSRRLKES